MNETLSPFFFQKSSSKPLTSQTMRKSQEDAKEKLENPYYYYGSTRNQKKAANSKPKPLLPSQRQQLELQGRVAGPAAASRGAAAAAARAGPVTPQFQRSRSLGGYYNRSVPGKSRCTEK